jgi:hypothetical protein
MKLGMMSADFRIDPDAKYFASALNIATAFGE